MRSVLESLQDPAVTNENLADLLSELSDEFTCVNRHAMAIMTSLVSQNCAAPNRDHGEVTLLMTELCEALLAAALENHSVDAKHLSPELRAFLEGGVSLTKDADESDEQDKQEGKTGRTATEKKEELLIIGAINQPESKADDIETVSKVALCSCEDGELLKEFLNESVENISNAEQLMLVLEETPKDEESLHGLFRAVQTIKGAAGFCEMEQLGTLAHKAESVLARVRDGELLLKDELFEVILISIDLMSRQLYTVQANHEAKKPLEYPASPELLLDCLIGTFQTGECDAGLLKEIKEILCEEEEAQGAAGQAKLSQSKAAESLRVDGKRLGLLINLVGELVITEGVVQSELQAIDKLSAASVGARLRKVVRDIQQLSLTLKMVPIGTLLHKNKRMVRDLSEKLGKPTRVLIQGADTARLCLFVIKP
ncbi:MAG: Hpt domain-containing protein [Planctomycetota bacterium]|nr:Hpt domain-containing protein [Planctomycetota bacterium]